jgi:uncharacterized protein (UPF0333 family)
MTSILNAKSLNKKGQAVIEYAVLLTALCLVFLSMFVYMQRSANAKLFSVQNQINAAMR